MSVVTWKYCTHKCRHASILFLSSPESIVHINTDMQAYYFCRHKQVLCTEIHTCRHIKSVLTRMYCIHKCRYAGILFPSSPARILHINTDMQTSFLSSLVIIVQRNTHMQTFYFGRHQQVLYT